MTHIYVRSRHAIRFAYIVATVTCLLGMLFTIVKSPPARSDAYLAAAMDLAMRDEPALALAAAQEAVRLNPGNAKAWRLLSELLQQSGLQHKAGKALRVAERLERGSDMSPPLYAMPADLKLSLIVQGDREMR